MSADSQNMSANFCCLNKQSLSICISHHKIESLKFSVWLSIIFKICWVFEDLIHFCMNFLFCHLLTRKPLNLFVNDRIRERSIINHCWIVTVISMHLCKIQIKIIKITIMMFSCLNNVIAVYHTIWHLVQEKLHFCKWFMHTLQNLQIIFI